MATWNKFQLRRKLLHSREWPLILRYDILVEQFFTPAMVEKKRFSLRRVYPKGFNQLFIRTVGTTVAVKTPVCPNRAARDWRGYNAQYDWETRFRFHFGTRCQNMTFHVVLWFRLGYNVQIHFPGSSAMERRLLFIATGVLTPFWNSSCSK